MLRNCSKYYVVERRHDWLIRESPKWEGPKYIAEQRAELRYDKERIAVMHVTEFPFWYLEGVLLGTAEPWGGKRRWSESSDFYYSWIRVPKK